MPRGACTRAIAMPHSRMTPWLALAAVPLFHVFEMDVVGTVYPRPHMSANEEVLYLDGAPR